MTEPSFRYQFTVSRSPEEVWTAVVDPKSWWSREIEGTTDEVGAAFRYHYQDVHRCAFRVTEAVPGRRLVWHVTENAFNFTKDRSEWLNTDVIFDLVPRLGGTEVTFTHRGLVPAYECFAICRDAWTSYVGGSLKRLIETGQGEPNPLESVVSRAAALSAEDFRIVRRFAAAPAAVMAAVETPQAWWSATITGAAAGLGDQFEFVYQDVHRSVHRVTERVAGRLAVWSTVEARLTGFRDPNEWNDTALVFEALPVDGGTELVFTHAGLRRSLECYADCAQGWSYFVGESLASLVDTGIGKPETATGAAS